MITPSLSLEYPLKDHEQDSQYKYRYYKTNKREKQERCDL